MRLRLDDWALTACGFTSALGRAVWFDSFGSGVGPAASTMGPVSAAPVLTASSHVDVLRSSEETSARTLTIGHGDPSAHHLPAAMKN